MTVLNKLLRAASAFPDRVAYEANGEQITYGELIAQAKRDAEFLRRQGTSPVILFGPKTVRTVTAIVACLTARRAYVPVGGFTPLNRLRRIIRQTGATLIVSDTPPEGADAVCCRLDDLRRFAGYPVQETANEIAYIIFTSGSTGEPKGVPITYVNLEHFVDWIFSLEPLRGLRSVNVLNQADFSFDLSVADLYYSLCGGHTLVCGADADNASETLRVWKRINVAVVTPTMMRLCLLNDGFRAENIPELKCVFFCGEPLQPATVQKLFAAFPGVTVINAYGPTEATCAVSAAVITPDMAQTMPQLPVGANDGGAVRIEIEGGEIVLKGESVFRGYLNGKKGGHFRENGVDCFRTGDLGFYENGWLYCRGRKDQQIKYKGYRIEPDEIEYHIGRTEGVNDCAVVPKRRAAGEVRMLAAYYTGGADAGQIREALRKELPEYMIPKRLVKLEKLPVNENGKLDRKALIE